MKKLFIIAALLVAPLVQAQVVATPLIADTQIDFPQPAQREDVIGQLLEQMARDAPRQMQCESQAQYDGRVVTNCWQL